MTQQIGTPAIITLTPAAVDKVRQFMEAEENTEHIFLRVAVQPGGCAGMRYALFFDDRELDDDLTIDFDGVPVRVERASIPMLQGTTIDWVDSLQGAGFNIDNPNAQQGCACGDSFC